MKRPPLTWDGEFESGSLQRRGLKEVVSATATSIGGAGPPAPDLCEVRIQKKHDTPVLRAMVIQIIRVRPSYGYQGYSERLPYSGPPGSGYQGYAGAPGYAGPPSYGNQGGFGQPDYSTPPGDGYPSHLENPTDLRPPGYERQGEGYPGQPNAPAYEYHGDAGYPAYPGSPGNLPPVDLGQPARPGSPSYGYQGDPPQPPEAGFSHDYLPDGHSGDPASEEWRGGPG